ncbi:MAG: polyhydroxyalkanoate depolymerase [Bdellovibrionales bacterium]
MNLYQFHDMQMTALAPLCLAAWATRQGLENPLLAPLQNEFTNRLAHDLSLIEKHARIYKKPSFNIKAATFRGEHIDVGEEITLKHPFCQMVHFTRQSSKEDIQQHINKDPKILIIPPLSGHFASILRDAIQTMLASHDVYVADWIDAKQVSIEAGDFDLDDQISLIADMIRQLGPDIHVLAVTQASFAALSAVALLSQKDPDAAPKSLTIMGGPIDARQGYVALRDKIKKQSLKWFANHQIQLVPPYYTGAMRPVYPGFLQLQNRMFLAFDNKTTELIKYFQHLVRGDEETKEAHERLYDEFLAVMDVPAELYLQYIERAYQQCALAENRMTCHGIKLDLKDIRKTALLTVEAELDDLSPAGQTRAALLLCENLPNDKKQSHLEIGVGHYGIFSGKKWKHNIQPVIHEFIRKHA